MARLSVLFDKLEPAIRERIARDALKKWSRTVVSAARGFAYPKAVRTKRQLFAKIKRYKHVIWCGIGVRSEKVRYSKPEQRLGRKSPLVGWKSHFMEVGWHAWPKGTGGTRQWLAERGRNDRIKAGDYVTKQVVVYRKGKPYISNRKERVRTLAEEVRGGPGKGWRRGLRGRKGAYLFQYAYHYLFKAAQVGRANAKPLIIDGIYDGIKTALRRA